MFYFFDLQPVVRINKEVFYSTLQFLCYWAPNSMTLKAKPNDFGEQSQ